MRKNQYSYYEHLVFLVISDITKMLKTFVLKIFAQANKM